MPAAKTPPPLSFPTILWLREVYSYTAQLHQAKPAFCPLPSPCPTLEVRELRGRKWSLSLKARALRLCSLFLIGPASGYSVLIGPRQGLAPWAHQLSSLSSRLRGWIDKKILRVQQRLQNHSLIAYVCMPVSSGAPSPPSLSNSLLLAPKHQSGPPWIFLSLSGEAILAEY